MIFINWLVFMIIDSILFKRLPHQRDWVDYQKFVAKIQPIYHAHNFEYYYLPAVYQQIELHEYHFLEIYLFDLLGHWVQNHEEFSLSYIHQFQSLIKHLKIANKFSFVELAYIDKIAGIEFCMNRKLKRLIPHFDLLPKEQAYFFYEEIIVAVYYQQQLVHQMYGSISITNKRIGIIFATGIYLLDFVQITNLKLLASGLQIELDQILFKLETNIAQVVYLSIDRIIQLEKYLI